MVFTLTPEQAQVSIKIEKPIYYPGEIIRGVIYLKIKTRDINAGILYIKLCGQEKVNQLDAYNQFFSFKQFIFKKQKKITDFGMKMPIVACRKYFEIEVPNLYPSFQINFYKQVQCRVLYYLSLSLQTKDDSIIYKPSKKHRVVVHIAHKPTISENLPMEIKGETKNLKKCCFSTGVCKINIQIEKPQLIFGEKLTMKLEIDNSLSKAAIQNLEFKISAQLIVLYKQQKRKLSNYFDIYQQNLETKIDSFTKQDISYELTLPADKQNLPTSIYPQSSLKTKRIQFQYLLSCTATFEKSLFVKQENLVVSVPLYIFQVQKREKSNIIQSMDNISNIGSIYESNSKLNTSYLKKFVYGDHNCCGYGEQDGYDGKPRKYNPMESLDEGALLDVKGALEKLIQKKQVEGEDSEDDDKFIEEIEGKDQQQIVSLSDISPQIKSQPKTIFSMRQNNDFQNLINEERKVENGNQDLQTIKEEQDSKGTQYNLNNALSSSGKRLPGDSQPQEQDIQVYKSQQQQMQLLSAENNEIDEIYNSPSGQKQQKKTILKNGSISSLEAKTVGQKEQKSVKVQFNENASAETFDSKTGGRSSVQKLKK